MADYLDQMMVLTITGVPGETSAEVKVQSATAKVRDIETKLAKQNPELGDVDANTTLLQMTDKLGTALKNSKDEAAATKEQLATLQSRFDGAMKASNEKETILLAEKDKFQGQFEKVRSDYSDLKSLLEKKSGEQVNDLYKRLDREKAGREETNKELLKTQAELKAAQGRIERMLKEDVYPVRPPPDTEAAAYKPDGKVLIVDDQAKIVHINLGSDDHVYRGLTFSVYDRGQPIPKDGRGKAEIEVYDIQKNISLARIIKSDPKNSIVVDDIVANLIWDPAKTNTFVVAGDFDLNGDGKTDPQAIDQIKVLVEKWGGKVENTVTVNTDFVILGAPPEVGKKPTLEETEASPNANTKYEDVVKRAAEYKQILGQAETLSIPILNGDRFLYFIGYKTQSTEPGAF
jgi:NAD-dependent DNA ligase